MKEIVLAEEEYAKHAKLSREAVQELMEWIRQHPEYPTPTEELVIRFIFSCYFDMENAKKCAQHYYTLRFDNTNFFLDRDVLLEELKTQLDVVQYGVVANKDPHGSTVILHRLQVFEPSQYHFVLSCRLFGMLIDALNRREGNMKGLVVVFDMKGVSLMHVFRVKLSFLKVFFDYVQEACPIRLKAVHVVNTHSIASKIMYVIKPFLKKGVLDLIQFHSDKYEEVQRHVPPDCLPVDFAGTQPTFAQLHEDYKKWMLELRDVFVEADTEFRDFLEKKRSEAPSQPRSSWGFF